MISLLWTTSSVRASQRTKVTPPRFKANHVPVGYELFSQVARAAALAFMIVGTIKGNAQQWYNIALVGGAFILGLSRLVNGPDWRHIALHQVNFLIGTSLLLIAAGELLPVLELHSNYRPGSTAIGAIVSLAAANLIALWTPREWAPPADSFDFIQRSADAGPAPEETCSWWNLYLTYEWLTPLIWKGKHTTIPHLCDAQGPQS